MKNLILPFLVIFYLVALFGNCPVFAQTVLDNVYEIELSQGFDYGTPNDLLTYNLNMEIMTSGKVEVISIIAPNQAVYKISQSSQHWDDVNNMVTSYDYNQTRDSAIWKLESQNQTCEKLANKFSDGTYTFIFEYADDTQNQTSVWFGVPDTGTPIYQPSQRPLMIYPQPSTTVDNPLTVSWQPPSDPAVHSVGVSLNRIWHYEYDLYSYSSVSGIEQLNIDGEAQKDQLLYQDNENRSLQQLSDSSAVSMGPLDLESGTWKVTLSYENSYQTTNLDGVDITVGKYSRADYIFDIRKFIYVDADATGANDGTSWKDSYNHLQDALGQARQGRDSCQIRVAEGTYYPDQGDDQSPGDPAASFKLINNVEIFGGYAGCNHSDPNRRDVREYRVNLSGDLKSSEQNSYHIVTSFENNNFAVLDGFYIMHGNSGSSPPDSYGAGIYISEGSPTIVNCIIKNNNMPDLNSDHQENRGGGVYCYNSNPVFIDCRIGYNRAAFGGSVYNHNSNPNFFDCLFFYSRAFYEGGAVYDNNSCPKFVDCVFETNSAKTAGGAICNSSSSSPDIIDCLFKLNSSYDGGAIADYNNSNPNIINCDFISNECYCYSSCGQGSAIANFSNSGSYINNCRFIESTSLTSVILNYNSTIQAVNSIFANNSGIAISNAEGRLQILNSLVMENRGALYNYNSDIDITNCTIAQNSASFGSVVSSGGSLRVTNSILWNNFSSAHTLEESQIRLQETNPCDTEISYSCIQGLEKFKGNNNIDSPPLFVPGKIQIGNYSDNKYKNLRLLSTSPCIDRGNNNAIALTGANLDLNNTSRIKGDAVDMGAYEFYLRGDIDGNSRVDFKDLAILAENWLEGIQ